MHTPHALDGFEPEIGAGGFEPPISAPQKPRDDQASLRPEARESRPSAHGDPADGDRTRGLPPLNLFDYYQTTSSVSTNPHHQEVISVITHFQAHRRTWIAAAILVIAVAVVLLVVY